MTDVEIPAAVVRLHQRARENGWDIRTRTTVGSWKDKPIDLVVTWFHRRAVDGPDERLVAAWENGKFSSAWQAWEPDLEDGGVSPRRIGARELAAVVTS